MYSKDETPLIGFSVFYYDNVYDNAMSKAVLSALEKYHYFPPKKIYAGKLTNGRICSFNESAREAFITAYSEKDISGIEMFSERGKNITEYWRFLWNFTFLKNSHTPIKDPIFKPWNVLTVNSTYGRLHDADTYKDFVSCLKELITILNPFYACMDDIANKVTLLDKVRETKFVPDRIQQLYWGNYFGPDHCKRYGFEYLENMPVECKEQLGNGFWFSLTNNIFDFSSKECLKNRKEIRKYLSLGKL